jgi:hypothetical protein
MKLYWHPAMQVMYKVVLVFFMVYLRHYFNCSTLVSSESAVFMTSHIIYVLRRHCDNENVFSNAENVQMTLYRVICLDEEGTKVLGG